MEQSDGLIEIPGSDRRIHWILSRKDTPHNLFVVPDGLSESKKNSALVLQVKKWAPFSNTDFVVQWSGTKASVYAWNADQAKHRIVENRLNPSKCTILPESCLKPAHTDGPRLLKLAEGYEGQIWDGGFLRFTRWWNVVPTQREWTFFLRTTGFDAQDPSLVDPTVRDEDFIDSPWIGKTNFLSDVFMLLQGRRIQLYACVTLLAPVMYFTAEIFTLNLGNEVLEREIAVLNEESRAVRLERSEAIDNLNWIEESLTLQQYPHLIRIIESFTRLVDPYDLELVAWNYNQGELDIVVRSKTPLDPTFYIPLLEKEPLFFDVRGSLRGTGRQYRDLRLQINVTPEQRENS